MFCGFADSAALDFGDPGGDGDENAGIGAASLIHFFDEMAQHCFSDLEIRDHPIFERTDCDDVARSPPEHAFCIIPNGEDFIGAGPDCHHRRLAKDDSVVFYVDEGVRGAEIDSDVVGKHVSKKFIEHGEFECGRCLN